MSLCGTNPKDHCCYVGGKVCAYLRTASRPRQAEGFYWSCALRAELGSWDAVHADPRYITRVKVRWAKIGMADCGDYPKPGSVCGTCGKTG
jgi:hypothetical protein